MEKRYFSVKEACQYTGMSRTSLDWLLRDKRIQPSSYGKIWYDKEDIDQEIARRKGK